MTGEHSNIATQASMNYNNQNIRPNNISLFTFGISAGRRNAIILTSPSRLTLAPILSKPDYPGIINERQ